MRNDGGRFRIWPELSARGRNASHFGFGCNGQRRKRLVLGRRDVMVGWGTADICRRALYVDRDYAYE